MADPALDLAGLSVAFPTRRGLVHALQDVDVAVPAGGALALVGESGSGKSTVLLALLGLLPSARVTAHRMAWAGTDLQQHAASLRGRRVAVVFQDPSSSLNPALTVGAQVAEPLALHAGLSHTAARAEAASLLAEVGLPRATTLAAAYPHQLSGGMKQRVAIAMALAARPELLLLDEPTTALDVTVEAGILDLLADLRAKRGLTLLLVSHNLGIVNRLCDQATVLYAGRVVEIGAVPAVLSAPRHPYTRGLLAALPRADRHIPLAPITGGLPDPLQPSPGCNFRPRCPWAEPACDQPQAMLEHHPTDRDQPSDEAARQNNNLKHASNLLRSENALGAPHAARCHRAADIAGLPWPTPPIPQAAPPPGAPLLIAEGLTRRFDTLVAVDAVSLHIAAGEVLGLVGESGCGKSTLGRLLLRLIPANAGTLRFDGAELPDTPPLAFRRRAQIVLQNPDTALNPRHTIGYILRRPLSHFGLATGRAATTEITRLLELVRLPPAFARRYPHQLSGGEKQRVGIARALASRPQFVVSDEAVSALDVSVQAAILNLLADLRRDLGLSLLFISHDITVVGHIADRIAVMYGGAIMEVGPAAAVLHPPYHPYTEALLSAVPTIGPALVPRVQLPGEPGAVNPGPGCRFAPRCHRRLGPVCDDQAPPWREYGAGHSVRCHLPPESLAA